MLYSYKQQYPKRLPNRIKLSNGETRTDSSTFTEGELADAGYVPVDAPPSAIYPNKLEWTGADWLIREPNSSEIATQKQSIQDQCVQRLFETDYKVIKAYETQNTLEPEYVVYRQQLRDLYNSVDTIDIWNVIWPMLSYPPQDIVEDI